MVKTPFLVAAAVILAVLAAIAYFEFRPAPGAVAPAAVVTPAPTPPPTATIAPATPPPAAAPTDCLLPGPPPVPPDGGLATAADMKLGHDVFQGFVEALEAYQTCRETQVAKADTSVTQKQKDTWRDQGNAAVDEANALAAAFSAQLKIYHSKHPEPLAKTPTK